MNGLFLLVIAFFVFTAAISRIFDPPDINTERLLVSSAIGLAKTKILAWFDKYFGTLAVDLMKL